MKRLLLILTITFSTFAVHAQLINPDFETWTRDNLVPAAKNPNSGAGTSGWWDFNFLNASALGGSPVTVFQDSVNPSPYMNNYCARIVSQAMSKQSNDTLRHYGIEVNDTSGIIFSGYVDTRSGITIKTGIPCNNAYKSFTFYFRYVPNGIDTCSCEIKMYHFNTVSNSRDQVGYAYWSLGRAVTLWSPVTVPINYSSSETPDTVQITFSAASIYSNPKIGDSLYIDYGSVVLGMNTIAERDRNISVYPDPASDEINFAFNPELRVQRVTIYDVTGRLTGNYVINKNNTTIDVRNYAPGTYIYKAMDASGACLGMGKCLILNR